MLILSTPFVSGLGEDTFWCWIKREFDNSVYEQKPTYVNPGDVILRYSILGKSNYFDNSIALLCELYPEMKQALKSNDYEHIINSITECAESCKYKTAPTHLAASYYPSSYNIKILPIGVNTDLFKPIADKESLRIKYGIPRNRRVLFWAGTTHPMKGFHHLLEWKNNHPNDYFIIVWKTAGESSYLLGAHNFCHIPQEQIVELMNCSDAFLSCGILRPFFMVEWEAMACNLPIINMHALAKDYQISNNPRDDVFQLGWDRYSAKEDWLNYINEIISENTEYNK